jgi:hypothetical protein
MKPRGFEVDSGLQMYHPVTRPWFSQGLIVKSFESKPKSSSSVEMELLEMEYCLIKVLTLKRT